MPDVPVDKDALAAVADELALMNLALAEGAERYRALYEVAPVAFVTTDAQGDVIEGNAAAARLLEIEERFLPRKPLAEFVDPSSRPVFRRWLLTLGQNGNPEYAVIRMTRRRTGVTFEANLRASAGYDGELLWVIEDVTERVQAEQRIREMSRELEARVAVQTAELEAVIEQMPLGLVVVDVNVRLLRANRRARDLLRGGDWSADVEVVSAGERPARRALRGEQVVGERYEIVVHGERAVLDVNAVPIRTDGAIVGAVVTFDDVTRQERRERADREFVSNAAHQIRTPITAIAAAVAALEAGAKREEATRDRFIRHIDEAVSRLSGTTEALLTLSRIERGDLGAETTVVRIRPLLERLADTDQDGRISIQCLGDVAVVTHEGLLQEAVASIVDNALRHTTGSVVMRGWWEDGRTTIEVADEGPGMTQELRERAVERFVSGGRGAGLGLSIAAAAMRVARAELELEPGSNGGTVARISLRGARMIA